ncbi:hypothetical protein [Microcoleus sp. MON2_D5]|uniref:hypothetical protein n=1 Tax=Microcoleus sp. MON2_D5 TaxID=2818833 RepID=UPI002FCF35D7
MAIPLVVQGLITEDGNVFELDSPQGTTWLETIGSFRYEPSGDSKAYTVRREPSGYWYGCRKVAGKVRRKYIGKPSEVTIAKLEEVAEVLEALPVSPEPRFKPIEPIESARPQDSQLRKDIAALYAMNARLAKIAEPGGYTPAKVAKAAAKAQTPLMAAIKALEDMDDIVSSNC